MGDAKFKSSGALETKRTELMEGGEGHAREEGGRAYSFVACLSSFDH